MAVRAWCLAGWLLWAAAALTGTAGAQSTTRNDAASTTGDDARDAPTPHEPSAPRDAPTPHEPSAPRDASAPNGVESSTPDGDPTSPDTQRTLRARRHFKNGIKLYRDANYQGALAEFEAAYKEKPTPSSLQNVAITLRALFRYSEAADALRSLLNTHGTELSADERRAVEAALDELSSLVGTLALTTDPPRATVTLNGRLLSDQERARGVLLNVGEHTLVADAPGYARTVRVVRIASQQRVPLALKLQPVSGFLEIVSNDPRAAIALNGEPLAYQRWSGPVTPGVDHTVQIYREGFEPFETTVHVDVGETARVSGALGAPTGEIVDTAAPMSPRPAAPPKPYVQRGVYALATLTVLNINDAPLGLQLTTDTFMPSVGARAGFRLSELLAIEAALDAGRFAAKGSCESCGPERNFSLFTLKFGPNLRLYTRGDTLRFTVAIGAGIVSHELELDATSDTTPALRGGKASGSDPYFSMELGASFNYRHVLAELALQTYIESASELRGSFDERDRESAYESETLPFVGLGLKVGYSAWAPRR